MHPGYQNPDVIAPSGPVDPALTVLSVQSRSGRPIAVLANYSMHYYGAEPVSADYYGRFAAALARRIGADEPARTAPPFVAIMSQGTSGDQMWMDYGRPKKDPGLDAYADAVAAVGRAGLPGDRLPRLGSAGDGRDDARARPSRARRGPAGLGQGRHRRDEGPDAPPHLARGLRQGGDLPARRAPSRAEAPGHPDRRAGHHRDPQRGLRHHGAEDQGTEPVRDRR